MSYILRAFCNEQFKDLNLDDIKKVSIGSGVKNTLCINSKSLNKKHVILKCRKGVWSLKATGEVILNGEAIRKTKLEDNQVFILSRNEKIALYVIESSDVAEDKAALKDVGELTIGRESRNNIVFANNRVSGSHAKIYQIGTEYHIMDVGSTNGTYVNNKIARDVILKENDEIAIGRYTIIFNGKELLFKNTGKDLLIHNIKKKERNLKEVPLFKRSPRLKPEIPTGEIEIQAAPTIGGKPEINWLSVFLPSLGMVGVMAVIGVLTGMIASLYYTAPMSLIGVVVSVTTYNSQKKKYGKQEKLRVEKYTEYIEGITDTIKEKIEEQLKALTAADPETSVCFNIARDIERRLWERKPGDADFASVRVGSGLTDFSMDIKIPNTVLTLETDQFTQLPKQIKEQYSKIQGIPVSYNSAKNPTCGIIGDKKSRVALVKNMVVQAATHHSYDELKIVTVYNREDADSFDWIRWLPHSFDNDKETRYMANSTASAIELFKHLTDVFKTREKELKDNNDGYRIKSAKLPYYLFVITDPSLVDRQEIMKYLTQNNPLMGIAAIFDFGDMGLLPDQCAVIVDVKGGKGCIYDKNNISSKTDFVIDDTSGFDFEQFSRDLAPIRVPLSSAGAGLPSCITFLEGYKVKTPNQIEIAKNWEEAVAYKSLAVPIGMKTNGERFLFDIHEKMHGPHGVVAGTTGSGKSEMVQTWILSMALHFSPNDAAFVLIDFKGTGLILPFMNLPHLAGTISDLDKNIKRNLIALENELSRRKEMLDGAGVNNINAYQKLYKSGKVSESMPYLFIVIDEFAEFKKQFPDFGASVDSILRTGRTLGVFSILLTQKPAGVVSEQSESNVKFRWCLKVAAPSDSRDMLGTTDAAQIANPGRAYVKVSNEGAADYVYELVQSYWSGAPYNPNRKEKATVKPRISVVDISGKRIAYDVEEKTMGFRSDINEIDAVVKQLQRVSEETGIKAKPIWTPKLPAKIVLEDIRKSNFDGNEWADSPETFAPIIGMVDDPRNQRQYPLQINFAEDGHTVIYGAPGTGKTTLLQTLVMSVCTSYKPDEVSIYIMDFGGWNMGLFKDFPHVGGVANDNESEKIEKTVRLIKRELDTRKHKFADEGVGNIRAYRDITGDKIPYVVLVLDNFAPVFNLYPELEDFFITLTREGGNYGIYFVTVTNNLTGLGYKINQNIKNTMALQMSDKSDYSSVVGRTDGLEPEKNAGRGLMKGETPLEFQTALPIRGMSDGDRAAKIRSLAKEMDEKWQGARAKKLPIMPEVIPFGSIESEKIVIGLSSQDIEPVEMSFDMSHYIIISGKAQSGKSNMIKVIAKQLDAERNIVFDTNSALKTLDCRNIEIYREAAGFDACIAALVPELERRRKAYQADENAVFSPLAVLIDDIKQCFDSVSNDTARRLYAITRIGKGLNVYVIAAGMCDDISKLCNHGEQLTCSMTSGYHSIVLGGCINDHDVFKTTNLSFGEKSSSVEDNEGYFIVREKAVRFKAMFEKSVVK